MDDFLKYYFDISIPIVEGTCDAFEVGSLIYINQINKAFDDYYKKMQISFNSCEITFKISHINSFDLSSFHRVLLFDVNNCYFFEARCKLIGLNSYIIELPEYNEIIAADSLLVTNPAIIYKTKPNGKYHTTYISPNVEHILGYRQKEFINNDTFWDSIIESSYLDKVHNSLSDINSTNSFDLQYPIKLVDGKYHWFKESAKLIRDEEDKPVEIVGYLIDINKQFEQDIQIKLQNQELLLKNDYISNLNSELEEKTIQLNEVIAQKDRFLSIIAHDLRAPLHGFMDLTNILISEFNIISANEVKELTFAMHQSSKKLYGLLENLLNWTKIQNGKMPYEPSVLELNSIIMLIIDLYINNANQKKIRFVNKIEPGNYLFCDVNILNTVIRNLVSNALKFTPEGGKITFSSKKKEDYIYLIVKDNGVGMSEELISKLFHVDSYVTNKGTNNEEGSGLGLIICKDLAILNKGDIFVESKVGVGTKFTLKLPACKFDNE